MLGGVLGAILYEYVFKAKEVNENCRDENNSHNEGTELKSRV